MKPFLGGSEGQRELDAYKPTVILYTASVLPYSEGKVSRELR